MRQIHVASGIELELEILKTTEGKRTLCGGIGGMVDVEDEVLTTRDLLPSEKCYTPCIPDRKHYDPKHALEHVERGLQY